MGKLSIVSMFVVSILCNVLGPSGDIYSDVGLMVNTLTFNLGESLLLSGCRACYKRNEEDVYSLTNRPCQTCFSDKEILVCGGHPQTLTKIQELQNSESCPRERNSDNDVQKWHLSYSFTSKTFEFKRGNCGGFGDIECCITPSNDSRKMDPFDGIDKRVLVYNANHALSSPVSCENDPCNCVDDLKNNKNIGDRSDYSFDYFSETVLKENDSLIDDSLNTESDEYDYHNEDTRDNSDPRDCDDIDADVAKPIYDIFLLSGRARQDFCLHLFKRNRIQEAILHLIKSNDTDTKILSPVFFKLKVLNDNISMEPNFDYDDGCGFYIRPHKENIKMCGADVCLIHLQKLHTSSDIFDLSHWKTQINFSGGLKVGGRTCRLLRGYGRTIIFPILLNLIFSFMVFRRDLTNGNARKYEIIPLIFLFYPQWKCLKYLANYAIAHKDEHRLKQDIVEFNREVASIEPFLESSLQVRCLNFRHPKYFYEYPS